MEPTFLYLPKYFVPDAKIQHGSEFMLGKLNLPQPTFLHLPKYLLNQMQKQNVATAFVLNKYGNINDLFKMAPHSWEKKNAQSINSPTIENLSTH